MDSTQDEWRQVTFYTKVPADVVTDKVCELDSIAHLSIFKQTDAPGRDGELDAALDNILLDVRQHRLSDGRIARAAENYIEAKQLIKDLIDSATRTAVTEALDKVAAALPEKRQLHPVNEEGHISVYLQYENGKIMASNEVIESVRAVIAAGGEADMICDNCGEYTLNADVCGHCGEIL